jgi:hypothetical protein
MKLFLALASLVAVASGKTNFSAKKALLANKEIALKDIKADSPLGAKLLSQARKLDQQEEDFTWVVGYSLTFQGCHHTQWNEEANGEEDVRITTKRLFASACAPPPTAVSPMPVDATPDTASTLST